MLGACECGIGPSGSIKCDDFPTSRGPGTFLGRTLLHRVRLVRVCGDKMPVLFVHGTLFRVP